MWRRRLDEEDDNEGDDEEEDEEGHEANNNEARGQGAVNEHGRKEAGGDGREGELLMMMAMTKVALTDPQRSLQREFNSSEPWA